jgi:hypothetical protein
MESKYLGTFSYTEKNRKTDELAARYRELTEAYDRTVCTGPIVNGAIQPVTPQESAMISRNAKQVFAELMSQSAQHEITESELKTAIRRHK